MKKLLSISLFFLALVISCEKNTPEPSKNTSDGFTLDSIEEKSFYLKPGENKILTPVIEDGYKYDVKTLLWEFTDKDIEGFTLTKVDDKSGKYIISVSKDVEIGTTIRLRIKGNGLSIIYTVIIEEAIFEDFGINGIVGDTLTMNLAKGMSSVTYEIDATLSGWGNMDSVYQLVYEIDSSDVIKLSDTTLTATGIGSAEVTVSVELKEKYKDVEHLQKTIPDPIVFNVDVITKEIGKIEIYINGDLASNKTSLLPNKTHTITTKVYDIDDELININPVLNLENTTKDCKITIKNGGLKVEEGDIFTEANNNATLKAEISGIKCSVDITVDFKRIEVKKIEIYINDNLASDEMSLLPNETHTITTKVYDIDDELVDIDPVLSLEDTTENSVISIENGTITPV